MIIAEIGQNHCGDMELAKKLILLARDNGASLVKFQLYDHKKLYGDAPIPNVELSFAQTKELFDYGNDIGIEVFFSVFDIERVEWCKQLKCSLYKISYSQRNNADLVKAIPTWAGVFKSTDNPHRNMQYIDHRLLYCVPHYPTKPDEIKWGELKYYDGFSDHTIGLDCAKKAISKGVGIIEKHFAIDHKTGIDAEWSMTPEELKELKGFADNVPKGSYCNA